MNWRILLFVAFAAIIVLAGTLALALLQMPDEEAGGGYVEVVSMGRAGEYGYSLYGMNGTGNITLLGLDEEPKDKIVVLSETGIGMDSFDGFLDQIEELASYGMSVEVVGRSDVLKVRDSILIVPTGAIPDYILDTVSSTGSFNTLIYIGKTDLKTSGSLRKDYWYTQMDEASKEKIIVKEYTLDEFMDEGELVESFKRELLENRWAVVSEAGEAFNETEEGRGSLFVPLPENGYLRMVYSSGDNKGVEASQFLPAEPVKVDTEGDVYPWERAAVSFTLGETTGKAFYTVEKDGVVMLSEDLGRIGNEKAFYYTYEFEEPGDYIVKVYDSSGMLGSTYVHVNEIEIAREGTWDVRTVFSVKADGEPVNSGDLYVSVNGGEAEKYPIIDGYASVPVKLQSGDNVFRVQYLEYKEDIVHAKEKSGTIETYVRYGPFIALLLVVVYVASSMRRKPMYTLKIDSVARKERNAMEVGTGDIIACINSIEERFGWNKVPVRINELAYSVRKHITDGADILDGDLETILKKMEEKKLVDRFGDYYQLSGWGDVKKNVLMRRVRDILVTNGIRFREGKAGFDVGTAVLSGDYFDSEKKLVVVFDGEEDIRKFTGTLKGAERARLEVKKANDMVKLVSIERLEEIL